MATIKDVARLAGVSTTTVSHVINKTRFVAENTSKKVWLAINELNYSPSLVARSLKCNTTKTIGMIVTKSTNPFFAEVINGVETFCFENGYSLIICNTDGDIGKFHTHIQMLAEKRTDGLLVMCSELNQAHLEDLEKRSAIPMVVMDWSSEHIKTYRIQDNAELGGYIATKYLIDNGHSKIACITGHLDKITCQQRIMGYKRALQEANIPEDPNWIVEADFECTSAVTATKKILTMQNRPTALFCFNDIMALAAMSVLHLRGIKVPQDMSIVGYDNIELAAFFSPPLTSIHQPKRQLGKTSVKLLFDMIAGEITKPHVFNIKPELVIRQSVMPR